MAHKNTLKVVQFTNGETYKYEAGLWANAIERGDCIVLTGKQGYEALKEFMRAKLLEHIKPNDIITTVFTKATSSGSCSYKVFALKMKDGKPYIANISRQVGELCGFRLSKDNELVLGGWGYSKSFQIGYSLGRALWPNGTDTPHGMRNGEPDSDGGYALTVQAY